MHNHQKERAPTIVNSLTANLATLFCSVELSRQVAAILLQVVELQRSFGVDQVEQINAERFNEFEESLANRLRELGRTIVEHTVNHVEVAEPCQAPSKMSIGSLVYYRKRLRTPRIIGSLFGDITLIRIGYESKLAPSVFPLELLLGCQSGVTPALANRIGPMIATLGYRSVLDILKRDFGISWSMDKLRRGVESVAGMVGPHRHDAQLNRLLEWLETARRSTGSRRPTLSVGRDGVMVPIVGGTWKEAAVATISVLDRQGKRLGTVYLGRMPESGQQTLTDQLTHLLTDLLTSRPNDWLPRLVYVSDDGTHPREYYHNGLRRMHDPKHPTRRLEWIRVVDFFHACEYISKIADELFDTPAEAQAWSRRMRHTLKHTANGIRCVLNSAAALASRREMGPMSQDRYQKARRYLTKRTQYMQYRDCRDLKIPIGSGITEAGCKRVFTQRFKQSGMTWHIDSGQWILDLRLALVSGVWHDTFHRYLDSQANTITPHIRQVIASTRAPIPIAA